MGLKESEFPIRKENEFQSGNAGTTPRLFS